MASETAKQLDPDSIPKHAELDSVALEADAVAFLQAAQEAVAAGRGELEHVMGGVHFCVKVPPLGEGDRGIVYRLVSHSLDLPDVRGAVCLKVAKQQPICRERLLEERMTTDFFLSEQVSVPRIHYMDPKGRFCVKDLVEGESITSLYLRFASLSAHAQSTMLRDLKSFMEGLLALFKKRPDCQVSISPNNIYVLNDRGRFYDPNQLVLIDPGTTLKKKYDSFTFETYWNEVLPDRIQKYQRTGYLQWLVPQQVTQSEGDEAREFEIFHGMKPSEVYLLLKAARTVELDAEEVIVKEGEIGENFYLVLEGEVEARRGLFSRPGSFHARIRKGSVLGEMAFLLHVPRSMTVAAATPCKLIEFDRARFSEMLDAQLTAPYKLLQNMATILAQRLYSLDQEHQKVLEEHGSIG
jgi:CRP-like cAMP-binding protein